MSELPGPRAADQASARVSAAIERMERALDDFDAAYASWAAAPRESSRELLAVAEARLTRAREALAELERELADARTGPT